MFIVISTTHLKLWENDIPEYVCDYILNHISINRQNIENLDRHHHLVVDAFRYAYGNHLEKCNYAKLREISELLIPFYRIIQIACYRNMFYPECIAIDVYACKRHYYHTEQYEEVLNILNYSLCSRSPRNLPYILRSEANESFDSLLGNLAVP